MKNLFRMYARRCTCDEHPLAEARMPKVADRPAAAAAAAGGYSIRQHTSAYVSIRMRTGPLPLLLLLLKYSQRSSSSSSGP